MVPVKRMFRTAMPALCLALVAAAGQSQSLLQTPSQGGKDKGQYIPSIWVDPDGCEHWVMDDGAEGFMTPHVTPDGLPVCRKMNLCGDLGADQLFDSGSAAVSAQGQADLRAFFEGTFARSFVIGGHTDSRASDAYNMNLSRARARAVAQVGQSVGATISEVRAYGERRPKVSNSTAQGRAQNRRVEIICVR